MKLTSVSFLALMAAGSSHAFNFKKQVPPDLVQNFAWKDPFTSDAIGSFTPTCEATIKLNAFEYTLHNLMDPHPDGLRPWGNGLKKVFSGREYPGGWAGLDRHLHDRNLLLIAYDGIPLAVREWIEEQERTEGSGKALFAVFEKPEKEDDQVSSVVEFPSADETDRAKDEEKVAIFAPGALYGILPLWAAEDSECRDILLDLGNYKSTPEDGGVVAWVTHTKPKNKKTELTIKVQVLRTRTAGDKAEEPVEDKPEETGVKDEL